MTMRIPGLAYRAPFLLLIAMLILAAPACDAGESDLPDGLYAVVYTEKGPITAELEHERTPLTVSAFVGLAEGTIENDAFDLGRPFYDGTTFHRVEAGHVIQTGRAASDRSGGPGFTYPNEIHADLRHDRAGILTVANGGPHTNASQFSFTLGDRSYLDGDYIVFGEAVEGMDVITSIELDDAIDSIRIVRVGEEAEAFRPDTESFRALVREAQERVAADEARKAEAEAAWIAENFPDAEGPEGGVLVAERQVPEGAAALSPEAPRRASYRGIRVRYLGHQIGYDGPELEEVAFGSGPDGVPGFHDPPEAFEFAPGEDSINPAVDEALAEMVPGERRTIVVPPEHGYGVGGTYPPAVPGEPRFVIGPHTLLVYELEVLPPEG